MLFPTGMTMSQWMKVWKIMQDIRKAVSDGDAALFEELAEQLDRTVTDADY